MRSRYTIGHRLHSPRIFQGGTGGLSGLSASGSLLSSTKTLADKPPVPPTAFSGTRLRPCFLEHQVGLEGVIGRRLSAPILWGLFDLARSSLWRVGFRRRIFFTGGRLLRRGLAGRIGG